MICILGLRSVSRAGIALGLILLLAGCSKTGKVTGKVLMANGQPLPGGTITFTPAEGKGNPAAATIKEDGTYEVNAPTGVCKVSIDNRAAGKSYTPVGAGGMSAPKDLPKGEDGFAGKMPGFPKGMKKDTGPPKGETGAGGIAGAMEGKHETVGPTTPVAGKAVPINSKYYSPETSGIELKVKGGSQTLDIKLE